MTHSPSLVPRHDEELLDDDCAVGLLTQRHVTGRLALFFGEEKEVARECLEHPRVAPALSAGEDALRQPEKVRNLRLRTAADHDGRHHGLRLHLDPAPLRLLVLGHANRQHAVRELRLDVVGVDLLRQAHAVLEAADAAGALSEDALAFPLLELRR